MDCSTPGLPVLHYFLELAHSHVHGVSDAVHPTISSSVIPFSSRLQSFPASGTFPMSQLFTSDDQNTGASASASALPTSIQGWFPLGLTGLISLLSKGLFNSLLQHHSLKASILWHSAFFTVQLSKNMWPPERPNPWRYGPFVGKVMSLLFNTLSRFVIVFLPRNSRFLLSQLQSPSTVILESKKRKSVIAYIFYPSICHKMMGLDAMNLRLSKWWFF